MVWKPRCVCVGGESSHAQTREMELGGNQSPSRFPEAQEFSAITKSLKKRGSPGGMWGVQRADYVQRKPGAAERTEMKENVFLFVFTFGAGRSLFTESHVL